MNNQDYEQKKRECWEEYCQTHPLCNTPVMRLNFDWTFDRAYALGKEKEAITQEDVEKASVGYADKTAKQYEVCNSEFVQEIMVAFEQGANFALGKQDKDADTVIQGWILVDEKTFQRIVRVRKIIQGDYEAVWDSGEPEFCLEEEVFPDMTPNDRPEPVEIIIKRKKK